MRIIVYSLYLLLFLFFCGCSNSSDENIEVETNGNETFSKDTTMINSSRIGIKMSKIGGVYQIPCFVNGVKLNFIFDTGASNVCISMAEAVFLAKNGYLEEEDYIGRSKSQIADGSVVENMIINLHSIEIEGIILTDVKAVVVNSINAPLLLGQSALQKLGRIEIDGDSLFITKEGEKKKVIQSKTNVRSKNNDITNIPNHQEHWYDKILALFGYDGKIDEYLSAANAAYENGLPEVAIAYCDKALELRESAKIYGLRGHYYYQEYMDMNDGSHDYNGMVGNALSSLERYYDLNEDKQNYGYPSGDTLYYDSLVCELAWADIYRYRKKRKYDRMLELGQELILRNPKNADAMNILGFAYTEQGNYKLAEKWAREIIDSHIDEVKGYFRLAYLSEKQGRYSEAVRYYEKCLEIDSDKSAALTNLANIYWKMSLDDDGDILYGEKYDAMRNYAVSLWQKAARLGNQWSKRLLKEKGYEW